MTTTLARTTEELSAFDLTLRELIAERARYEDLRRIGASLGERADSLERLHGLRSRIALLREGW